MRLATITNWAYGITVVLTLASGMTMLLAAGAHDREQAAVEQRYGLDHATARLSSELYALTGYARQFALGGDPSYATLYAREQASLGSVEQRIAGLQDLGAGVDELSALKEAIRWADGLHDEQQGAIAARQAGDVARARRIVFGPEYQRELDRAQAMIERFQYRLDQRTETDVAQARSLASLWRRTSEIVLAITGLLFLCVLYFVFRQRVLRPVVTLSDVVGRLAAQDYATELPDYHHIDEIGDMAQALRVFRTNGLERQRLEQERDADRTMRDLLSRMTQRMQGCGSMADLRVVVERFMPEIAPGLAGILYLRDPVRRVMVEASRWHEPTHSRREFSPLSCWALGRGSLHRPQYAQIDVPCDHLTDTPDGQVDTICVPLIAQREIIGLLYFEAQEGHASASPVPSDVYLTMLAENVGLAIANLQLRDALHEFAMTDPLTGLANRRRLDMSREALVAEATAHHGAISCIMLDIDHFKRFNDEFGHEAGDSVLREVGTLLKALSRDDAQAYRYGGEEFVLFLPGVAGSVASDRAEEIRTRIAALRVREEGRDLGPITASLGLASAPDRVTPDRLLQAADAALRLAKRNGRNRIAEAMPRGLASIPSVASRTSREGKT